MRIWSISIGRIFGIDIRIHLTFVLLLFLVVTQATEAGVSATRGIVLFLTMLGAVLLHELAHALVAVQSGVRARQLVLLPIGGVALFNPQADSDEPRNFALELRAALAGPALNLLVALVFASILTGVAPDVGLWSRPWIHAGHLLRSLVWINAGLALLNLMPAYPLDGGRILRAWLARSTQPSGAEAWHAATRKVVGVGQGFAMLLTLLGIVNFNIWAMLIGFFIFVAAHIEDRTLLFQNIVDNVRMDEIMLTDFSTLSPADTLEDAMNKAVHSLQDDFPVVRGNSLVGTISRHKIVEALRAEGNGYIQGVMNRGYEIAAPSESLASAFRKITRRGLTLIPIVDRERLVGIVTLQNLTRSMGLLAETRRMKRDSAE
jgi:Zn-dependent protease/predicted transcriptional regulator